MAIPVAPLAPGSDGMGRPPHAAPASTSVHDALRLVADLAQALDQQCRRAARLLEDDPGAPPELRAALLALSARARQAAERAPALLVAPPTPASPRQEPADTRECAVALAVTMKLEGASPQDVESWLRQEFGRDDAGEITAEAFGGGSAGRE